MEQLFNACTFFPVRSVERFRDIFFDGHIRKQRVVLQQIPDPPDLRPQINARLAVVEDATVHLDPAFIRRDDTGDAFQGLSLIHI